MFYCFLVYGDFMDLFLLFLMDFYRLETTMSWLF